MLNNIALARFRAQIEAATEIDPPEEALEQIVAATVATWTMPPAIGARCRAEAHKVFWVAAQRHGLEGRDAWLLQRERRLRTRPARFEPGGGAA